MGFEVQEPNTETWHCNASFMHVMGLRSDITGRYAGFEKVTA